MLRLRRRYSLFFNLYLFYSLSHHWNHFNAFRPRHDHHEGEGPVDRHQTPLQKWTCSQHCPTCSRPSTTNIFLQHASQSRCHSRKTNDIKVLSLSSTYGLFQASLFGYVTGSRETNAVPTAMQRKTTLYFLCRPCNELGISPLRPLSCIRLPWQEAPAYQFSATAKNQATYWPRTHPVQYTMQVARKKIG